MVLFVRSGPGINQLLIEVPWRFALQPKTTLILSGFAR